MTQYVIEKLGLTERAIHLRKDGLSYPEVLLELNKTNPEVTNAMVANFFQRHDGAVAELAVDHSQISKEIMDMEHDIVSELTKLVKKLLARCKVSDEGALQVKDLTQLSNAVSRLAETIGKFQGKIGKSGNTTVNVKSMQVENKQLIYTEITKTLLDLEAFGKIKFVDDAYRASIIEIRSGKKFKKTVRVDNPRAGFRSLAIVIPKDVEKLQRKNKQT